MGCCGGKEHVTKPVPEPKKRAAQLEGLATLPEHLQLGVTLAGMRELLLKLPSDALEQVNAQIPVDQETGEPKFPTNDTFNAATPASSSSTSGPRSPRRASRRGTGWPCASG